MPFPDGRIDSPPTLCGPYCLFGTRNGLVYCLRAVDGRLVWQFRAAPSDTRLVACEQLESVWPVHGAVLVDEQGAQQTPVAYFAAGRSSDLDGGIHLYGLEVPSGRLRHHAVVCTGERVSGPEVIRRRALPDILSLQGGCVWMRALGVDRRLQPVDAKPHLFAPRGFLDQTWWHRTYWIYGTSMGGGYSNWPTAGNLAPAGRLLAFDGGKVIYGYGRLGYRRGNGHVRPPGTADYKLFAEHLPAVSEYPDEELRGGEHRREEPLRRKVQWAVSLPFVARAMVLAEDDLLVAGGPSLPGAETAGEPGSLWIVSRQNGAKLAECPLPAVPVFDGMALADAGVFISTKDGTLVCLREE